MAVLLFALMAGVGSSCFLGFFLFQQDSIFRFIERWFLWIINSLLLMSLDFRFLFLIEVDFGSAGSLAGGLIRIVLLAGNFLSFF